MNNNRLAACVGFFLFVLACILLLTESTVDVEIYMVIGLALMLGGTTNCALGGGE